MGRYRASKKRKRGLCKRRKGHESDPECNGTETKENSPAWNSLDEETLLDYAHNAASGSDEMEVTKRLSCLNFSVIPCAMDPENFSCEPGSACIAGGGGECASDVDTVDFYSELTSATNLDILPGERDAPLNRRQGRKRSTRRKPNKKTKKMKSLWSHSHTSTCAHGAHGHGKTKRSILSQLRFNPLAPGKDSYAHSPASTSHARAHSQRRMELDENSVSCFLSDTSAMCDMEILQDGEDDMFDCTPPADPSDSGYPCHDVDLSGNESELSETTTDSGCEGDDEESSVERSGALKISGWWDKEPLVISSADEDDERFSQILNGSFPLMSKSSQRSFKESLALSEFKHPGKFGISGGSGRKKRRKPTSISLTPKEINQKIIAFVQSTSEVEFKFQLVSRALCRTIASLAGVYQLECVIEQKRRLPVASPLLKKTPQTRLAAAHEVEPVLNNHGRDSPTTLFKGMVPPEPMSVVGGRAPPLDDSNVGNRMLQHMGWRPGTGLGPQGSGIQDPILAYVRPRHMGLGY